jgi:uncharacterized protein
MLISVKALADGDSMDFCCSDTLSVPRGEGAVQAEVSVNGSVTKNNADYIVTGRVAAVLSLECDLCLKAFESRLELELNESFSEQSSPDSECWELSDKTVDLRPAVVADILLNMPMRTVCSDNCKGLCPVCGHNLNDGDCGCDRGVINPQFEKLLALFKDDKEV